jgi:hypothetical protein
MAHSLCQICNVSLWHTEPNMHCLIMAHSLCQICNISLWHTVCAKCALSNCGIQFVPNMQYLIMAHNLCQTYNQLHEIKLTVDGNREVITNLQAFSDVVIVFCVITLCRIQSLFERFGGKHCLCLQGDWIRFRWRLPDFFLPVTSSSTWPWFSHVEDGGSTLLRNVAKNLWSYWV